MMRGLLIAAGLVTIVSLGLLVDTQSRVPAERTTTVSSSYAIYAAGRIEGATPEIALRCRTQGQIVQINVQEGELVESGQVLLRLDDEQFQNEVALAEAQLELASAERERLENGARKQQRREAAALYKARLAELEKAQISWERTQRLIRDAVVSQQEVDDNRTLVKTLKAEVEAAKSRMELLEAPAREDELQMAGARISAARARVRLAQVELNRRQLRATAAGQVLRVNVEEGELTGPASSESAIVLADTSRYRVRAFVEELDAPRVALGMSASVRADGLPNQVYAGHIVRLSPRMTHKQIWSDEPNERLDTKTREVWIELEDAKDLVVGLRVDVTIETEISAAPPPETAAMTWDTEKAKELRAE